MRNRVWTVTKLLISVTCLLPALNGCGGNGSSLQDDLSQSPAPAAVQPAEQQAEMEFSESRFPVRMRPQEEISEGLKAAASIRMEMPLESIPFRAASAAEIDVPATAFQPELMNSRVEAKGDYLVYRPIWNNPIFDTLDDAAYAIYQIDMNGYTGDPTVGFNWAENGLPRIPDKYFVAFSNWDANRWSWYDGPLDQVLTVEDFSEYTNAEGELLMVVLALHRENVIVLRNMTLGAAEMRGTGFVFEDIPISSNPPPVYVPTLPSSVDLSEDCAPINDQGTWGACTAFAVGDGAYNYELNSIYSSLGWDLGLDVFRVSPKFIYVESGKDQHFPPGGDYGRYTDQVARGLTMFGTATEANAPYDLVYDDNWSIQALNDAAVLKSESYTPLPCRSDAGIESIKVVLSMQQRPVLVSTQVDYGLFNFIPGTVWDYKGPSFGGHAMLIVGFDDAKQAFLVRNSWGTDWGDNGYLWMSYDSLKHPYNWYVQCGYIRDEYDDATALRFTGNTIDLLPPTGLIASDGNTQDSIELIWQEVEDATGYRIYRDTGFNMIAELGQVGSYLDDTIADDFAHTYWITSLQGTDESPFAASDIGYRAQVPIVEGVSPQGGAEGQVVRFVSEVQGSGSVDYEWDFGGGANPNTSSDPGPVVVLAGEGSYDATLKVTSPEGTQTFDWTLTVGVNQPPFVSLIDQNMDRGIAPYLCTLDATTGGDPDGYIVLYEFDWENDGIYDLTTTEAVVQHTYTEIGNHIAKVRVMDDSGQYGTSTTLIIVDPDNWPPWPTLNATPLQGNAPLDVDFDSAGSRDQDGFIEYYEWDFDNDGTIDDEGETLDETDHTYTAEGVYTARLILTDDEGATNEATIEIRVGLPLIDGWTSHTIRQFSSDTNTRRLAAAFIDGKPAAMCATTKQSLEYFSSSEAIPTGISDWSIGLAVAENGLINGFDSFNLIDLGGVAFAPYNGGSLRSVKWTGASWLDVSVDATIDAGKVSSAAMIDGKPAIAYTYPGNPNNIYYAYSTSADPTMSGDWVITELDTEDDPIVGTELQLLEIGGMPYLAYGRINPEIDSQKRLWLARGLSTTPASPADWSRHIVDPTRNSGNKMSMAVLDGRPAIAYSTADNGVAMRFAWADSATPASTDDWNIMQVEEGKQGTPSLAVVGGVPMFCYNANTPNGGLTLAQASSSMPAGDGDWSYERLLEPSDMSSASCVLLDLSGAPCIIYSWHPANAVMCLVPQT